MKNIPLSLIIIPIVLLLLSGLGLISLYSKEIPTGTELKPNQLHEVKTILDRTKDGNKAFNVINQQNNFIAGSNKVLKSGWNLMITALWSIIGLTIINLYFFLSWWKNRYNKAIKRDV